MYSSIPTAIVFPFIMTGKSLKLGKAGMCVHRTVKLSGTKVQYVLAKM